MGIGYGWLAPTMKLFQESMVPDIIVTEEECSWIGSLHDIGRVSSPLIASVFLEMFGRAKIIAFSLILFFVMWLLTIFTTSVYMLYLIRLMFGFSVGISDIIVPIYLGENLAPELRGIFGGLCLTSYYCGVLIEYVIATFFSYKFAASTNALLGLVALLSLVFLTEPVQFLTLKGKFEQAEKNFIWLSNINSNDMKSKFEEIKEIILEDKNKKLTLKEIFINKVYVKVLSMIFIISMLVVSTGIAGLNSFVSIALVSTESFSTNQLTIFYGICQFAAAFMSSFIIELFDRRVILIFSLILAGIIHVCSAVLYYVQENVADIPGFPWLVFISISSYAIVYSMGIASIFFIIRGELFPSSIKSLGGSLGIIGNSGMGFLTTKMFLIVLTDYGIYYNFIFNTFICFVAAVYVYFVLPETRGKSLQEIQKLLAK